MPGWHYIPPADGLIGTLCKKFRSVTHISDANMKIKRMNFDTRGKEDIRAFAAKLDALLIITGQHYKPDNTVINGARAKALFRTLPPWLEAKIRKQGILEKASLILTANKPRFDSRTSNFKPNNFNNYTTKETSTITPPKNSAPGSSKDYTPPKKKISELTPKECTDMIAQKHLLFLPTERTQHARMHYT
jgi:phage gp29-like protein